MVICEDCGKEIDANSWEYEVVIFQGQVMWQHNSTACKEYKKEQKQKL